MRTMLGVSLSGVAAGLALCLGPPTRASADNSTATSATKQQQIVVGDLALRVPAEWRRAAAARTQGVFMFDPRHDTASAKNHAVTFSLFSFGQSPGYGLLNEAESGIATLRSNPSYSRVRGRNLHLPGVHAFELTYRAKQRDGLFQGRKYQIVHRGRMYVITFETSRQQAAPHLAQIAASIRSTRYLHGPYAPDIRGVVVSKSRAGILSFHIRFRHPTKLTAASKVTVFLDTDLDSRTGVRGSEYVLFYFRSSADLANSRTRKFSRPKSLRFAATPRSATFRIGSKALGSPAGLGLRVYVARGTALIDEAPLAGRSGLQEAEWAYPGDHKSATVRYTSP